MTMDDVAVAIRSTVLNSDALDKAAEVASNVSATAAPLAAAIKVPKPVEPVIEASGAAAADLVARLLPSAVPVTLSTSLGSVRLEPGMFLPPDVAIVTADSSSVEYVVGQDLLRYSTSNFLRSYFLSAAARAGATAAVWVEVSKVEIGLITGLLVPWQALLVAKVPDILALAHAHRAELGVMWDMGFKVLPELVTLARKNPKLAKHLLLSSAKEVLKDLPSSVEVTASDVAFFAGRCTHGLVEETGATVGTVGGKAAVRVILTVSAKIAGLHLGEATPEAIAKAARSAVADLQEMLKGYSVTLTEDEAYDCLLEALSDPESRRNLQDLTSNFQMGIAGLETLARMVRNWRPH